jgi:hypothetical protein
MLYSSDQQPMEELRENLQAEQVRYQQAIKDNKPFRETKKLFSRVKEIKKKLQKSEVRYPATLETNSVLNNQR